MATAPAIDVFEATPCGLGESTVWDYRRQALLWVDGAGLHAGDLRSPPRIFRKEIGGELQAWPWDCELGSLALASEGRILVADRKGVHLFDPATRERRTLVDPEPDRPRNRMTDGATDRQGRFWVGSLSLDEPREGLGALYRLDVDHAIEKIQDKLTIPNSLAWSPDGRTMYFTDSPEKKIWSFKYDLDGGTARERRVLYDFGAYPGVPDGATVDAQGCLWSANFGTGRVFRVTPDGRLDAEIILPTSCPTCLAFGGARFDTLFVSTARLRMSDEQLAPEPLAGATLALRVAASGLPETCYLGA